MPARVPLPLALLVVLAALAAACGGGGGDPPDPTTQPSTATGPDERAAFLAQADAVCGRFRDRLRAIPDAQSATELAAALDQGVQLQAAEIAELSALQPPAAEAPAWRDALALLRQIQAATAALREAVHGGAGGDALQAASDRAAALRAQAAQAARALGLQVCGAP